MIVHRHPQGSDGWLAVRAGVITASMFATARQRLKTGPNKGDFSAAAKTYAFRLAIERIGGIPLDEGFETWQMRRGVELEPAARFAHELALGGLVMPCGFVTTDDGRFGASADGLVGDSGGAEYKCLVSPEKLRDVYLTGDISDYLDQVHGGLWITGREWWDFCVYCPALESIGRELFRLRVERDDTYIAAMADDLEEFAAFVASNEAALRKP
jgi:hypothetical protein